MSEDSIGTEPSKNDNRRRVIVLRYRNYTTQIENKFPKTKTNTKLNSQIIRLHCRAAICYEVETDIIKRRYRLYFTGLYRSSNAVRCALDAKRYSPEGRWYTVTCGFSIATLRPSALPGAPPRARHRRSGEYSPHLEMPSASRESARG